MVPDSKFDDAAGIYNPKQEAFPGMKDRGLGSDHRDSFADSHNNREYKGLDTNNMRTVENDISKYAIKVRRSDIIIVAYHHDSSILCFRPQP